jgi:hypothetical protein
MPEFSYHGPRCTGSRSLTPEQLDLAIALTQEQITIINELVSIDEEKQTELLRTLNSLESDLQTLLRHRSIGR